MRLTATSTASTVTRSATTGLRATLAEATATGARLALYGAIVLSPFRARWTLESRPLSPVFGDYRDSMLFWSEVCVLIVLALWALSLALRPRRIEFGPALLSLPAALLLALVCVSVAFSAERGLSAYNATVFTGFALLSLYVLNEVRDLRGLLPALVVMVLVQAAVAIGQLLAQQSLGLQALGEFDLRPEYGGVSVVWPDGQDRLMRAYALADHPNVAGGLIAFALVLLAALLPQSRPRLQSLLIAVFATGVVAVFATFSRSAALALAAGTGVSLLLLAYRREGCAFALWAAASFVALVAVAPFLWSYRDYVQARVEPTAPASGAVEERSLSERGDQFRRTLDIFTDHPLTGVGVSALPTEMYRRDPDSAYSHSPAHFVPLTIAAETGVPGAIAYGALIAAPGVLIWRHRDRLTPELIGATGALVAVHVAGLFDNYTWVLAPGRLWLWLALGVWLAAYRGAIATGVGSTIGAANREST